jgi:hypothetical protein
VNKIDLLPEKFYMQALIDQKLPSPVEEDVKGLVGKALVDPAIVAQRFGLKTKKMQNHVEEKQKTGGSRKVRIGLLQLEGSFY